MKFELTNSEIEEILKSVIEEKFLTEGREIKRINIIKLKNKYSVEISFNDEYLN